MSKLTIDDEKLQEVLRTLRDLSCQPQMLDIRKRISSDHPERTTQTVRVETDRRVHSLLIDGYIRRLPITKRHPKHLYEITADGLRAILEYAAVR